MTSQNALLSSASTLCLILKFGFFLFMDNVAHALWKKLADLCLKMSPQWCSWDCTTPTIVILGVLMPALTETILCRVGVFLDKLVNATATEVFVKQFFCQTFFCVLFAGGFSVRPFAGLFSAHFRNGAFHAFFRRKCFPCTLSQRLFPCTLSQGHLPFALSQGFFCALSQVLIPCASWRGLLKGDLPRVLFRSLFLQGLLRCALAQRRF